MTLMVKTFPSLKGSCCPKLAVHQDRVGPLCWCDASHQLPGQTSLADQGWSARLVTSCVCAGQVSVPCVHHAHWPVTFL